MVRPAAAHQTSQFTFLDGGLDGRLLRCVERTIVVRVIACESSIHFADMSKHRLAARLNSTRRHVGREVQPAISHRPADGFHFRRIKLAVLVRVERREIGERFGDLLHGGDEVRVLTPSAVTPSATKVAVGECKRADAEDKPAHHCECFNIFHTLLFVVFISLPSQLSVARSS